MNIKLKEIINNINKIKSLLDKPFPIKVSYKLSKLSSKLVRELKTYDEAKNKLILELGEKNEDGSTEVKDPKKIEELNSKHQELIDIDVEVDFEKIKIEDLGDIVITPNELVEWIFE